MLILTKKPLFFDKSTSRTEFGGIILISFEGEGTDKG